MQQERNFFELPMSNHQARTNCYYSYDFGQLNWLFLRLLGLKWRVENAIRCRTLINTIFVAVMMMMMGHYPIGNAYWHRSITNLNWSVMSKNGVQMLENGITFLINVQCIQLLLMMCHKKLNVLHLPAVESIRNESSKPLDQWRDHQSKVRTKRAPRKKNNSICTCGVVPHGSEVISPLLRLISIWMIFSLRITLIAIDFWTWLNCSHLACSIDTENQQMRLTTMIISFDRK